MAFGLDINFNEQKLTTDERATIFPQHDKCKKNATSKTYSIAICRDFSCVCMHHTSTVNLLAYLRKTFMEGN